RTVEASIAESTAGSKIRRHAHSCTGVAARLRGTSRSMNVCNGSSDRKTGCNRTGPGMMLCSTAFASIVRLCSVAAAASRCANDRANAFGSRILPPQNVNGRAVDGPPDRTVKPVLQVIRRAEQHEVQSLDHEQSPDILQARTAREDEPDTKALHGAS